MKKEISPSCLELLCVNHLKNHTQCKIIKSRRIKQLKTQVKSLQDVITNMPVLEDKNLLDFYNNSINNIIFNIEKEQLKIRRMISLREQRLSDLVFYVNEILKDKNKKTYENILLEIKKSTDDLNKVFLQIQKGVEKFGTQVDSTIENVELKDVYVCQKTENDILKMKEKKKRQQELTNNIINNSKKLITKSLEIKNKVNEYENFYKMTTELKNLIMHNKYIKYAIELLNISSNSYLNELINFNESDLLNSFNSTLSDIKIFNINEKKLNEIVYELEAESDFMFISHIVMNKKDVNYKHIDVIKHGLSKEIGSQKGNIHILGNLIR